MFANTESTNNLLRRSRLASLLVGSALLFAACGGAAEADEPTVAALPDATESAAAPDADGPDTNGPDADDSGAESDADSGPAMTSEEAGLAFSQCLEERGIDDPFAAGGGEVIGDDEDGPQAGIVTFDSDADFEAFEEAQEECGKLLGDAFGDFSPSPEQEAAFKDAELKFNQCMTDLGFEMSGGAIEVEDGGFEKLEEATKECDSAFEELNEQLAEDEDN